MENGSTPKVSTLSTLWFATSKTGERTQVAYVQEIPALKSAKEAITYNQCKNEEGGKYNGTNFFRTNF